MLLTVKTCMRLRWRKKQEAVLRQEHQLGEKGSVAWAGATIPVQDPVSGEIWQAW